MVITPIFSARDQHLFWHSQVYRRMFGQASLGGHEKSRLWPAWLDGLQQAGWACKRSAASGLSQGAAAIDRRSLLLLNWHRVPGTNGHHHRHHRQSEHRRFQFEPAGANIGLEVEGLNLGLTVHGRDSLQVLVAAVSSAPRKCLSAGQHFTGLPARMGRDKLTFPPVCGGPFKGGRGGLAGLKRPSQQTTHPLWGRSNRRHQDSHARHVRGPSNGAQVLAHL